MVVVGIQRTLLDFCGPQAPNLRKIGDRKLTDIGQNGQDRSWLQLQHNIDRLMSKAINLQQQLRRQPFYRY